MFKKKMQRKTLVVESYSCIKSLYKKSKTKHLTKQNTEKKTDIQFSIKTSWTNHGGTLSGSALPYRTAPCIYISILCTDIRTCTEVVLCNTIILGSTENMDTPKRSETGLKLSDHVCFHAFWMCFLDMCARTPVKYYPGTTPSKYYSKILLRYYYKVQMTCALVLSTLCLLVCFHAFWMCFPFVVCVFWICVHVLQ